MNNLYISGDFYVSELITDAAVIERFEKDNKAFIRDWKDKIRGEMRLSTGMSANGPTCVNVTLSKEIPTEEGES